MQRFVVANIADIMDRRARTVFVEGDEVALFRLSTGEIKAVENKCPHKGGKLSEGMICDHHVFCPLHDWRINLNDGLVEQPDEGSIKTYPIEVDKLNGDITLFHE
jgi:nitrite reductase (NADH) small subunit